MLAGVATRRHDNVAEPVGAELEERSKSMSKSAVSRRFVAATTKAMGELMARNLDDLDGAVLMIDGLDVAGSCAVVALVITTDATLVPVGLWLGDTENKTVVTALLADLVARGLDTESGVLCVIDGAKALTAGIKKVFGETAKVQRCVLHKRRNLEGHLPKEFAAVVDKRLALIFAQPDAVRGLAAAKSLAKELGADHPDAAGSLGEGLDDMFTVRRLGVGGTLAATLTTTNCIESMISIAKRTTRRVTKWKDGSMKKRWVAAGMLEAERSFRRVRGPQGHDRAGRCPPPRGHTGRCCTRRIQSGSSLNTLWPPLHFNKKRDSLVVSDAPPEVHAAIPTADTNTAPMPCAAALGDALAKYGVTRNGTLSPVGHERSAKHSYVTANGRVTVIAHPSGRLAYRCHLRIAPGRVCELYLCLLKPL